MEVWRSRLAPSPTGALHLGNARTFLLNWLRARQQGGELLMRVDDLDHPKVKPGKVAEIFRDLEWLGLTWQAAPPPENFYRQSARRELYAQAFAKLQAAGLVYPCVCKRQDVQAAAAAPHAGEDLVYPGTCRGRFASIGEAQAAAGEAAVAWRFVAPAAVDVYADIFAGGQEANLAAQSGDFIVARGEPARPAKMLYAYQLACLVDDLELQISEVVRGDDLILSAHRQRALAAALGGAPPAYLHLPLLTGADGRRLAKRHGDTRLSHLRRQGLTAARLRGWLAYTCGWAEFAAELSLGELEQCFDLARMRPTAYALNERDNHLFHCAV